MKSLLMLADRGGEGGGGNGLSNILQGGGVYAISDFLLAVAVVEKFFTIRSGSKRRMNSEGRRMVRL